MDDFKGLLPSARKIQNSRWSRVVRHYARNLGAIAFTRWRTVATFAFFMLTICFFLVLEPEYPYSTLNSKGPHPSLAKPDEPLHVLISATHNNTDLCKTLFSAAILEYTVPVLMGWGEKVDNRSLENNGGGTHLFKIPKVLKYLDYLGPEHDQDLVIIVDGFDMQFQLRKSLLVERYHHINEEANKRISSRIGRAASAEGIKQTIIFGSSKRCYPNELHTIACWPLPPSPLPKDMWGGDTDKAIGSYPNPWSSTRQRFLNSGMIMGPVGDMRALFARAQEKMGQIGPKQDMDNNGNEWSAQRQHSSDQSIFNMIFGEQEYQREVMRLRHLSWFSNPILKWQQLCGSDLSTTDEVLEGNRIYNIINPPFSHYQMGYMPGKPFEFSLGLDYWSSLSFQTANSERNTNWITYSKPLEPQTMNTTRWDCKPRVKSLPWDLRTAPSPFYNHELSTSDEAPVRNTTVPVDATWLDVPLYTNICTGTVPAMVHYNGDKDIMERDWDRMWYQPYAKMLLGMQKPREVEGLVRGLKWKGKVQIQPGETFTDTGEKKDFVALCPGWDFR